MNIIKMWILDNVRNAISSKGRQLKQTYNDIVNSPEMQYVQMAAPRSRIINARNQLWWAWQNYINSTYPETFKWEDNTSPYYKTYWIQPRYSEESKLAAENYNKIYDEFAPVLWVEAETWRPYSRNYWTAANTPEYLNGKKATLIRVSAPARTTANELIDETQNVAPAITWQAPWMNYRATPLFKEWEIKQGADLLKEMKRLADEYKAERQAWDDDNEKYGAILRDMVEKNWRNEAWANKHEEFRVDLINRRDQLDKKEKEISDLIRQYKKQLADMTKASDLINYKQ